MTSETIQDYPLQPYVGHVNKNVRPASDYRKWFPMDLPEAYEKYLRREGLEQIPEQYRLDDDWGYHFNQAVTEARSTILLPNAVLQFVVVAIPSELESSGSRPLRINSNAVMPNTMVWPKMKSTYSTSLREGRRMTILPELCLPNAAGSSLTWCL